MPEAIVRLEMRKECRKTAAIKIPGSPAFSKDWCFVSDKVDTRKEGMASRGFQRDLHRLER